MARPARTGPEPASGATSHHAATTSSPAASPVARSWARAWAASRRPPSNSCEQLGAGAAQRLALRGELLELERGHRRGVLEHAELGRGLGEAAGHEGGRAAGGHRHDERCPPVDIEAKDRRQTARAPLERVAQDVTDRRRSGALWRERVAPGGHVEHLEAASELYAQIVEQRRRVAAIDRGRAQRLVDAGRLEQPAPLLDVRPRLDDDPRDRGERHLVRREQDRQRAALRGRDHLRGDRRCRDVLADRHRADAGVGETADVLGLLGGIGGHPETVGHQHVERLEPVPRVGHLAAMSPVDHLLAPGPAASESGCADAASRRAV